MLSLARGLDVLRAFGEQPSMAISDVAACTGLSRGSAGRCLYTLAKLGYLQERAGRYTLTPGLLPLACNYLTSTPLASASQAIVNGLRDKLQETISVGVLNPVNPGQIIYIARAERNQVIAAPLMVGSTLPSHCTSMGRVLLAAMNKPPFEAWLSGVTLDARTDRTVVARDALALILDQVGNQRYSLVEGEFELGLRSLAIPVRARGGDVLAALNVATFANAHMPEYLLDVFLPELRAAAGQLERAI